VIELIDITKTYRMGASEFQALKGISFRVEKGELVSIVGPSGSGKSTTMHIIGLLDRPTSGKYIINDQDASNLSRSEQATMRNKFIGFIFQSFFLLNKLSSIENVGLPLYYRGVSSHSEIRDRSMEMLKKVDMEKYATHKPNELSGGQRQRVAIARALVGEPELVLADEPTGALDSKTSQQVMDLLKHLSQGTTVIIITHDLGVAKQCPRVMRIADGLITEGIDG